MTGASAQWSTFLQPRPWPIGQTSAKTSSLREPTAQDLALKKIQIHPIRGPGPGARWVYQKKSASEKMSVPILSKDPQGQEKIRYFR